jgi:pyruvate-ferredoxin/flavodoxin oxidoreductase
VFGHSNPLSGLKKGGFFIIQSNLGKETWASFPLWAQKQIVDNEIRVFYLDAFQIAREEAGAAELQLRMQGIAFQGAFFAASPTMAKAGLTEARCSPRSRPAAAKFGGKGARVVEDNLRVVQARLHRADRDHREGSRRHAQARPRRTPACRSCCASCLPAEHAAGQGGDIHRFWEQTGNFYLTGKGNDNLVDPFIGASLVPAATGVFRDMTGIRFEHPEWIAENCTACGKCYTECPDSAIPGLVSSSATCSTRRSTASRPAARRRATCAAPCAVEKKLRALVDREGGACVR